MKLNPMTQLPEPMTNVLGWQRDTFNGEWLPYLIYHDGDRWQHVDESLLEDVEGLDGWHKLEEPEL